MKFKLNNWKYFAVKGPFCLFDYSDHLSIVILFNILTNIIQLKLEKLWWKPAWILMAFFKVIVLVFAESPYVDKTQGWNLSNISCLTPLLTGLVLLIVLTQLLLQSHYKVKPKLSRCHSQSFRGSSDTLQKKTWISTITTNCQLLSWSPGHHLSVFISVGCLRWQSVDVSPL